MLMFRFGLIGVIALTFVAGCSDWTRVPPPPVHLSALESSVAAAAGGEAPKPPTRSRLPILRAIAPGALATIHVPDMAGTESRFKRTTIHDFLTSPEFSAVFKDAGLDPKMLGKLSANMQIGGLTRALKGEFVVSLEDFSLAEDSSPKSLRVLAALTVHGAESEVQQMLDMLVAMLGNNDKMRIEEGSIDGTGYVRIRAPKTAGMPMALEFELALHDDILLAGIGREVVTDAIARLKDTTQEALPDDASFGHCMQRVSHPHDIFRVHLSVAGLMTRIRDHIPAEAKPILDVLGAEHIRGFGAAVGIVGKDLVTKTFLDSPDGKDFASAILKRHTADRGFLERVPSGATSFSLFTLDGRAILQRLRDTLPEHHRKEMDSSLAKLGDAGFDLENGVLKAFGPRCALVTVRAGRRDAQGMDALWNQLMGTALVIEEKDGVEAVKQFMKLPVSNDDIERTDKKFGEVSVVTYRFPRESLPRGSAICIARVDGYLIVALSEETMREMLKTPTPESTEQFRKMVALAPENAVAVSYDDLSQSNSFLMLGALDRLNMGGQQDASGEEADGKKKSKLPRLPTEKFGHSVSFTLANEQGVYTETRSPTGGLTEVGGLGGVISAAAVVLPSLAAERVRKNETNAVANLQAIRGALKEYRDASVRDSDRDGEGEYVFLADLISDEHSRDGAGMGRSLLPGFKRAEFGYEKDGYLYRIYLPAEDGAPISEHDSRARRNEVDGDLAESIVVVVAWPKSAGLTGRRAFFVNGAGRTYSCDDGYGGKEAPAADLFSVQKGNLAAARIEDHARPRDKRRWAEWR